MSIDLPFRTLVLGHAGTGRTTIMGNLIKSATWNKVVVLTPYPQNPLYQVIKRTGVNLLLTDNIQDVPSVDEFNPNLKERSLLIVDDMDDLNFSGKQLQQFEECWIRGRLNGISLAFSSHSYLEVPELFRKNSTHLFITKLSVVGKKRIAREHMLDKFEGNVLLDPCNQDPALRIRALSHN